MKIQIKRTARFFLDPKSMIFGVAIFNFIWMWLSSPEWHFHRNIFMAALLLISSLLLLLNKSWSNLMAAILSGYLPLEILWEFYLYAHDAEIPIFSYQHFAVFFFRSMEMDGRVLLFIALTLMILARAVFAVVRSRPKHITSNDA
jgi:hypothetical protein